MQTKSHIKSVAKYNQLNYENLQIQVKKADAIFIDEFCKSIGLSKAQTIIRAVKYCYEHNIDLHEQIDTTDNNDGDSERN